MGRHLIVDGYNLSRSGALFLAEDPAGPEGRDELCGILSRYARARGFHLTVVFDGRGGGSAERSRRPFKGGTAVYSSRSETADDVIRDLVRTAAPGTVVVTSDRGLRGTLTSRSAAAVSCSEFAQRLFAHRMADTKGEEEEERPARGAGAPKKGEGRRRKKGERKREDLLRKL